MLRRGLLLFLLSLLPAALTFLSRSVLPAGSDPHGYGPALVGTLAGLVLSPLFGFVGVIGGLVAHTNRAPRNELRAWIAGTLISLIPLMWVCLLMFGFG